MRLGSNVIRSTDSFDVVILGSGFAGSLLALCLRQQGRTVLLVESRQHPRFAIGESSTPLTNLLLEEISRDHGLEEIVSLSKWGSWQQDHSNLACGLKRGFTFFHHTIGKPFHEDGSRRGQLLVAASPHDGIADTHWYRPDFDQYLAQRAQAHGAVLREQTRVTSVVCGEAGGSIQATGPAGDHDISYRWLIDASGPRGALFRLLQLSDSPLRDYPRTSTVYAHFRNVARVETVQEYCSDGVPPYPPDDAAMHHVFDGGWIWILRFNNGIVSAGAALTAERRAALGDVSAPQELWQRLLESLPSVRRLFLRAEVVSPFYEQNPLSSCVQPAVGPSWLLLPSAMGFVDPLLSTGFPLTLLGIQRVAKRFREGWNTPELHASLATDQNQSLTELRHVARLIAALYSVMDDFPRFSILTRLYFAAVAFSETARRLGKGATLASGFLLSHDPRFVQALDGVLRHCRSDSLEQLDRRVSEAMEPWDVAGLDRRDRRNWYPVDAEDLYRGAWKLEASVEEIRALLNRGGFFRT